MGVLDRRCGAQERVTTPNNQRDGPQQHGGMHREGPGTGPGGPDRGLGDGAWHGAATGCWQSCKRMACAPSTKTQKVLCAVLWIAAIVVGALLFVVIFPRFVDRVVNPFMNILREKLTPMQIGAVILAAIVLLPFTIVITVIPFVWVAGIIFTFPLALTVVMAGSAVGMALQYLLARYIFYDKVERFVTDNPKRHGLTVTLRAVELAGPWKVVALLRLGPFPYHLLNYALGICPSIKFHVYIICSVVCEVLPRSLQVFFGRSLDTLADLFRGRVSNVGLAVYNVVVLLVGILFVVFSVVVARRLLKRLEEEELKKEAAATADAEIELGQSAGLAAADDKNNANVQRPDMQGQKAKQNLVLVNNGVAADQGLVGCKVDMEILVEDGSSSRGQDAKYCVQHSISRLSSSGGSGSSSSNMIPAGFLPRAASAGSSSCSSTAV